MSDSGATTSTTGTPYPVDPLAGRVDRTVWIAFLGGPVIGMVHFFVVYLIAEAGCPREVNSLDALGPPVPRIATIAATVIAALGCVAVGLWAQRLRSTERTTALAFPGLLLAGLFLVTVLTVGSMALVLGC